ncbi:MAG: RNA polymerase sigma factor [Planctomycetota bacterium]|nr:RNA polymerase sigma factor [Planctomycetota bacterium]
MSAGGEDTGGGSSLRARLLQALPVLTRFVRRRMGPALSARESSSDIVQSTCRELLRSASNFEDRGEASFQSWMHGAAEHKLQNRARHWGAQRRQGSGAAEDLAAEEPSAPDSSRPSHDAQLSEEVERLQRAFAELSPEHRHVLQRSQIEGASHAEIAAELGKSADAVRKLLSRAMAALSAELDPE